MRISSSNSDPFIELFICCNADTFDNDAEFGHSLIFDPKLQIPLQTPRFVWTLAIFHTPEMFYQCIFLEAVHRINIFSFDF